MPVILMTSQGSEEIAVRALQAGAASYVPNRHLGRDLLVTLHKVLLVSSPKAQPAAADGLPDQQREHVPAGERCLRSSDPLIAHLQETAMQMGICTEADRTRLGVALEEALANALFHGNLEVSSDLRESGFRRLLWDDRIPAAGKSRIATDRSPCTPDWAAVRRPSSSATAAAVSIFPRCPIRPIRPTWSGPAAAASC